MAKEPGEPKEESSKDLNDEELRETSGQEKTPEKLTIKELMEKIINLVQDLNIFLRQKEEMVRAATDTTLSIDERTLADQLIPGVEYQIKEIEEELGRVHDAYKKITGVEKPSPNNDSKLSPE